MTAKTPTLALALLSLLLSSCAQHAAFVHDVDTVQKPWSHEDFLNDPQDFQFVIVTDRTGGHRPGVFPEAAKKLNLLQPEFVLSVGDLIEGYTEDLEELQAEWQEFNSFVEHFDMPFFYLAGNHDISNQAMQDLWEELYGRSYYHFRYKDALFLCLNTQETPDFVYRSPDRYLSDTQIEWARSVLEQNQDVRWTFVLMHQPLWVYEQDFRDHRGSLHPARDTGFRQIEQALAGRDYTVFAGHLHRYTKYERQDSKYFILATTGGISDLRGPEFGEFDHGVWVTMKEEGPVVVNLLTDAIRDEEVFTEAQHRRLELEDGLLRSLQFEPAEDGGSFVLKFENPFHHPLEYGIHWRESAWRVRPEQESGLLDPGTGTFIRFEVADSVEAFDLFPECELSFHAGHELHFERQLSMRRLGRELAPPVLPVAPLATPPLIDGALDDPCWQKLPKQHAFRSSRDAATVSCPTDARLGYDEQGLYIGVRCFEPNMDGIVATVGEVDGQVWTDDSIELFLDVDPLTEGYVQLVLNTRGNHFDAFQHEASFELGARAAVTKGEQSWQLELIIPWEQLGGQAPESGSSWRGALARNRIQEHEVQQLPPLYGRNHQPDLFGTLRFE